ncbi:MAG: alpha/beta hydrolase [Pseudoxanthomonas suwonensis]|nr:MAG: alpha/beta hydrolase [Pseudoxanthomonas suwonensis]
MTLSIHEARVPLADGQVFVRTWQPAQPTSGIPIVLLHDSLGSVAQWREFPLELAGSLQRAAIAYDRPGFGQSSVRADRPGLDFIDIEGQRLLPALLDALQIDRCILFGHSVGGAMALVAAAHMPQRCAAVITESAQSAVEQRTLDGIRAAQAQFAQPGQLQRLQRWHGEKAQWVLDAWTQVWLDPAFRHWSLDAVLPQVLGPVLAIHGDRDEYGSQAFPQRIVAGVSGPAQLCLLPDCGHVPHRELPGDVLAAVAAFLSQGEMPDTER